MHELFVCNGGLAFSYVTDMALLFFDIFFYVFRYVARKLSLDLTLLVWITKDCLLLGKKRLYTLHGVSTFT